MTGKQLRNSILQWAIQGKLVPQDPNDEPASVLIERIRAEKARLVKEKKIKRDKNESVIYRGEDNSYYEKNVATGSVRCIDEEIPFDIPKGWEWVRLNSVCQLIEDCPHSTAPDEGEGYPLIRTPNVGFGELNLNDVHRVSEQVYLKRNFRATPRHNDLIFAREAPAGNIAVIKEDEKVCLGQRTVLIRTFEKTLAPMYLAYYILSPTTQEKLISKSAGTTVAHVNLSDLRPYLIALPPISEQNRIVAKIKLLLPYLCEYEYLNHGIEKLNTVIFKHIQKSLLQEAIQGKLVPHIESEGTAEDLLAEIRAEKMRLVKEEKLKKSAISNESRIFRGDDNKYYEQIGKQCAEIEVPFDIPDSWQWVKLGNIISLLSGRDLEPSQYNSTAQGIPYITGASNFISDGLKINRWTQSPVTISLRGDLLITCKGTIGTMCFNNIGDIHIARQIMAINGFANLEYIRIFLSLSVSLLNSKANSMIPGISRHDILSLLIPLPPMKEQHRIVEKVKEIGQLL